MISRIRPTGAFATAIALVAMLVLAGCSGQSLNMNDPQTRSDAAGLGVGTLLGAGGGALVGAAIAGVPGVGAGIGALIGAGAGWAVASQNHNTQTALNNTEEQLKQQQAEIEENRHAIDNSNHQSSSYDPPQAASNSAVR